MATTQSNSMRKSDYPLIAFYKLGLFSFVRLISPTVLTVLNYHRIDDIDTGFDTFRPNVSATPSEFARQMEYVSRSYHVISIADLVAFIKRGVSLPAHSALITFDDGYLDNYTNAYPILKKYNLPAVIFLATDFIGTGKPFYWDLVAYCFHYTQKDHANLPKVGSLSWVDQTAREKSMLKWIEALKKLPELEKQSYVDCLPEILDVSVPSSHFKTLTISWEQARELTAHGIEMGGHTASHPILTRIGLEQVTSELSISKHRIEEETKQPILSMAYPNGQATDFNLEIMKKAHQIGYEAAFSLLPGPTRYTSVARQPLAIRRIFLSHEDNFSRFVAKLVGVPRLIPNQ